MAEISFLDIPKEFLGAAVFIDDALIWPGADEAAPQQVLVVPEDDDFGPNVDQSMVAAAAPGVPTVNAEHVVDGFSELGLVCSTYRWRQEHQTATKSMEKADLIIFDWKLDETERTALDILAHRLKSDLHGRTRLRYVAIYTDRNTDSVLDAIVEDFNKIENITVRKIADAVDVKVVSGPSVWRIKHFKKNEVLEKDLAVNIVNDFASYQDGILPRTVMAAVAEVRNRTYEHLFRFNSNLDKAITTHLLDKRSSKLEFSTSRESFAEYATALVLDDIAAALYSSDLVASVTDKADLTRCLSLGDPTRLKISDKNDDAAQEFSVEELKTVFFGQDYEVFRNLVREKLGMSVKDVSGFEEGKRPLMLMGVESSDFASISLLDQFNSYPKNIDGHFSLRSGTILKSANGGEGVEQYFLCLQPVCDAVRLVEKTSFPLLKLKSVQEGKKFRFPVLVDGQVKFLASSFKLSDIVMADFDPHDVTRDVRTDSVGGLEVYTDASGSQYVWLAELKEHYAAEAQSSLAAQGGRIGSNKFEWLRRKTS